MSTDQQIAALTDQQALSIVDSLAAEFAPDDMPSGRTDQADALGSVVAVDTHAALEAPTPAAAQAARELLRVMADNPAMSESVKGWLANPPKQEQAVIPLLLAAPVVITGCIALLTVIGNVKIERDQAGKWTWKYDPGQDSPMNKNMVKITQILSGLTHGGKQG